MFLVWCSASYDGVAPAISATAERRRCRAVCGDGFNWQVLGQLLHTIVSLDLRDHSRYHQLMTHSYDTFQYRTQGIY
jgi:hypothetical protein